MTAFSQHSVITFEDVNRNNHEDRIKAWRSEHVLSTMHSFMQCLNAGALEGASGILSPTTFVLFAAACLLVCGLYGIYTSLVTRLGAVEADMQMRLGRMETLLTRLDVPAPSRRLEHLITRLVDSEQHRKDATLPKLCSEIDLSSGFSDCTGCQATLPKPCSEIEISSGFSDRTGSSLSSANNTAPLATLNAPMGKLFSPPRAVITNSVECVSSRSLHAQPVPARSASVPRRPAASMPQGSATSLPTTSLPATNPAASLPTDSSCGSKQFTLTVEEALRMLEAFESSGNFNRDYFSFVLLTRGLKIKNEASSRPKIFRYYVASPYICTFPLLQTDPG